MSTKLLECAAMGKPVVASRLPTVEGYFDPGTLSFYEPGDPESLATALLGLVDDAPGRHERIERTRQRVGELSWTRQAEAYMSVVDRLIGRSRRVGGRRMPEG
jgi:glycosyltransferase involved in cell wall biosynthesis